MLKVIKDNLYNITIQPETRPILLELLNAKVKAIYTSLIIVKDKCIKED
jgi:hypothetical protein